MSHRTQITLTDDQYALLKRESKRTGAALSELIRRAVSSTYNQRRDEFEEALQATFGLWKDREFDTDEYLRSLRGPGLGHRFPE